MLAVAGLMSVVWGCEYFFSPKFDRLSYLRVSVLVFTALRTYALLAGNWFLPLVIFLLYGVSVGVNMVRYGISSFVTG